MKVHDEAISEPEEVSKTLIKFCRKWYGEGREGRWNVDEEGKMDLRGEELMTALISGDYDSVARENEEEELPGRGENTARQGLV